jgi:hypothetical protein
MRCLYCGKELALLKRLRRGGEFCSDAHEQSYQEEYNRLGLSRLLQARSRADESKGVQKPPAAPVAPVAVEERPVDQIRPEIEKAAVQAEVVQAKVVQAKVVQAEEAALAALTPAVIPAPPEPPPPAMAGFAMETPSISAPPEPVAYLEPWMPDESPAPPSHPPTPAWHLEGPQVEHSVFTLRSADLVPLELQPRICESSYSVMDTSVTPREEGPPRVHLSIPLTVNSSHEFEQGGSVALEILPRPSESSSYASLNGALDFSYPAAVQVFDLLDLSPAGIAYPAEDCDVTVPGSWTNGIISPAPLEIDGPIDIIVPAIPRDDPAAEAPEEPAAFPKPEATPRAALQALSKLHQDMRDREEAKPAAPPAEPALPAAAEASSTKSSSAEPTPREAELLAIPVKSFAPPKASPMIDAAALLTNGHPLLPRLKALPLRAKVALAPLGFGQPAAAKAAPQASAPPSAAAPPKPSADKSPKPAPPPPETKASPAAPAAKAKPPVPPAPVVQAVPSPPPSKAEPVAKPVPVKNAPAAPQLRPPQAAQPQKPEPDGAPKASPPAKSEPAQKTPAAKEEPAKVKAAAAASSPSTFAAAAVPNFGAVVNTSMFGSLTAKLGIAALTIVVALAGYFGLAPKSGKPSAAAAKSVDSPGMSIMVGEGGWVENWAGDPIGQHGGREITIYRPSLKLSDYRIEFQGQIDTKSIGWIFRAADPDNYYAMKLELVSPELPLTVVLYKYIVIKGRQVQVGRVPIDLPVKNDTVFGIRMDVRGPKFTTYVQGQSVDVWTDDQIRSGGVGFLNERSERGKIKSVSLSYLSGGAK